MPNHALQRAFERYGLTLTGADLKEIARMIQNNQGVLDKQQPDKTTIWFLNYQNTPVRLVMHQDFYKIITFLPLRVVTAPKKKRQRKVKIWRDGRAEWVKGYPV